MSESGWALAEVSTGRNIVFGQTREETIASFYQYTKEHNITPQKFRRIIEEILHYDWGVPQPDRPGYYYVPINQGGEYFFAPPRYIKYWLIKGEPITLQGWEDFSFFLHIDPIEYIEPPPEKRYVLNEQHKEYPVGPDQKI